MTSGTVHLSRRFLTPKGASKGTIIVTRGRGTSSSCHSSCDRTPAPVGYPEFRKTPCDFDGTHVHRC